MSDKCSFVFAIVTHWNLKKSICQGRSEKILVAAISSKTGMMIGADILDRKSADVARAVARRRGSVSLSKAV